MDKDCGLFHITDYVQASICSYLPLSSLPAYYITCKKIKQILDNNKEIWRGRFFQMQAPPRLCAPIIVS